MKPYEIPLSPEPQKFQIQLAGVTYWLRLRWNQQGPYWVLDISDADEKALLLGLPVITGLDLLAQYRYLGFGGYLIVQTDYDPDAVPTLENLGVTGRLYFLVED